MIGRLFGGIAGIFMYFCIATVLAAVVLIGFGVQKGRLTKNRIDRLVEVLNDDGPKPPPEPDTKPNYDDLDVPWDEIAMARALAMRDAELREHALTAQRDMIALERDRLAQERAELDRRDVAQRAQIANNETDNTSAREEEARAILEGMQPAQAKEQIKLMLAGNEENEAVRMLVAMQSKKRDKIIAQFTEPGEVEMIQKILKRVREGYDAASNDTATQLK